MTPFKLLQQECSTANLNAALDKWGYVLRESSIPDSAYEPSVLSFEREAFPNQRLSIFVEKKWWPDGQHWEDSRVRLLLDDIPACEVDLDELLTKKLQVPFRRHTLDILVKAVEEANRSDN